MSLERRKGRSSPTRMDRLARIEQAAKLRLMGKEFSEIATILDCHKTTAFRMVEAAKEEWMRRSTESIEKWRAQEVARLEVLFTEAYHEWERSKTTRERKEVERNPGGDKVKVTSEEQAGDPALYSCLLRTHERICTLLGLDAPRQINATISESLDIPDKLKALLASRTKMEADILTNEQHLLSDGPDGQLED